MLAMLTDVQRATERLTGIMIGISIDGVVNATEIHELSAWLNEYAYFHDIEPFKIVVELVQKILEDNHVDGNEKDEMLELCWKFDSEAVIPRLATTAIRRLHGVLNGISLDNRIRDQEVVGFKNWLKVS